MNYKKLNVGVTGGSGLIGSFLIDILVKKYSKVIVIDDFSTGQIENISHLKNDIELRTGDLEDFNFCKKSLKGCDHIYHLASRAYGIGYSEDNQLRMLIHNERVTNNLVDFLKNSNVQVVFVASSSCIYDDNGPDVTPELPIFLDNPEFANRGYGWAKRFLESKINLLSQETKMKTIIVRPFNVYGERYRWRGKYSHTIPMLIHKTFKENNPVVVWGSGKQKRSYLHAYDCAKIFELIFDSCYYKGPINVGLKETISIGELAELIAKTSGIKTNYIFDKSKPEGRIIKSSDIKLQKKIIPFFEPKISLKIGILKMVEWYKKNDFQK